MPYAAYSDAAMADTGRLAGNRMLIIPLLTGELIFNIYQAIYAEVIERAICLSANGFLHVQNGEGEDWQVHSRS